MRAQLRLEAGDAAAAAAPDARGAGCTNACCREVSRQLRLGVGVGRDDVDPEHDVGPLELGRGLEAARGRRRSPASAPPARSARRRRRAARARPPAARRRGWSRGSRLGTLVPVPGTARTGASGSGPAEVGHQLEHVGAGSRRRRRPGCGGARAPSAGRCPGARPRPRSMRPGIERRQRAELLGDDQRRVVGQHDPAGAHADGRGARRDVADHDRGGGAGDARHVVVLGVPEAPVAPPLGVAGEVERRCAAPAPASPPSTMGARSRMERGTIHLKHTAPTANMLRQRRRGAEPLRPSASSALDQDERYDGDQHRHGRVFVPRLGSVHPATRPRAR